MERPIDVVIAAGARPNFMKVAPLYRELIDRPHFDVRLVHTGQHFSSAMSANILRDVGLPDPHVHLGAGGLEPAEQLAEIVAKMDRLVRSTLPDIVVVVGDVTSTLAVALAASLNFVPVAHVEAGLRARDWSMPEERNRVLVDRLSDLLFTPSIDADENLIAEGIDESKIHRVGNIMIDSLDEIVPGLDVNQTCESLDLVKDEFALVTLHRPSNVDENIQLSGYLVALNAFGRNMPVVFPVHPRTRRSLGDLDLDLPNVRLIEPLGYRDFIALLSAARLVLTDSGGIQEEASVLGVPCLTLRDSTERPITVLEGTNRVIGTDPSVILKEAEDILGRSLPGSRRPDLWDGKTAGRIADVLLAWAHDS
jgi:UDP-N-acetylglucosamine 2-epimerase (non-hydrolysing)